MFCVDRNNVGVQIVKDKIKTDSFVDPARDITNIKLIERYGLVYFMKEELYVQLRTSQWLSLTQHQKE
jgi:hypothetical protein